MFKENFKLGGISMVEDFEIKATTSPFAVRANEIKVFDGKDGYVSINQIINKINIGHITEVHFKIMETVNEFEFITSRQLYQVLQERKIDIKSQDKLNDRLEQLIKCKILTRYFFRSEEGDCTYRVYCLEKMGKYLLNSRGVECNWQPTDNTKPVGMVKKRLAGNQTILAYLRKVQAYNSYIVKPTLSAKRLGKVFKAHGGIQLTRNDKTIDFIFEVVRREDEWEKKFSDRMKLYKDFYDNFVTMDCGYERVPQLIIICEDDKHMAETFKTIIKNQLEPDRIKLYFSTDLRQNQETLSNTLVEFKLDETTNKYKMEEPTIKLLG